MKVHLMHRDRDFDPQAARPPQEAALTQDLELNILLGAMANGDAHLLEMARSAFLAGLDAPASILYRQQTLADCLDNPAVVREMYAIAVDALQREKGVWGALSPRDPEGFLRRAVEILEKCSGLLNGLRQIADAHCVQFRSEAFTRLFGTLTQELDDDFLGSIKDHLRRLRLRDGVLMSAELDQGNKQARHLLHSLDPVQGWLERFIGWVRRSDCSGSIGLRLPD